MPPITAVTRSATVSTAKAPVPSEAEVRGIRKALGADTQPADVVGKVPPAVAAFAKQLQKKEGSDISVGVQTFDIGNKHYYQVNADNEGNGHAEILNAHGDRVTGYSYSESEGPNWYASPKEAQREKAAGTAASQLFTRSALGTPKLASYEMKTADLPKVLKDQLANHNVKAEKFYKVNIGGQTMIADYVLYQGADKKPGSTIGNVTLTDVRGAWQGSANILNKSTDKLTFGFNLGRPE